MTEDSVQTASVKTVQLEERGENALSKEWR